jgi:hypothetical protein
VNLRIDPDRHSGLCHQEIQPNMKNIETMELSRRDAIIALVAGTGGGIANLAAGATFDYSDRPDAGLLTPAEVDTLVAVAEVVYPSELTGIEQFVEEYAGGLGEGRQSEVAATLSELDSHTRQTRGRSFADLPPASRESVLRGLGVNRVGSSPSGTFPERVRYFIVNQLLYGLFTSPKGSRLVGISNPVGYPGGYESYQNPPASTTTGSGGEERLDE